MSCKFKSIIVIVLSLTATSMFLGCKKYVHPPGRDTRAIFGNGRFQMMRSYKPYGIDLCDLERPNMLIVRNVTDWQANGEYIYVVNKQESYFKVNYLDGIILEYSDIEKTDSNDKDIFKRLKSDKKEIEL
jgi:hypothetical protein